MPLLNRAITKHLFNAINVIFLKSRKAFMYMPKQILCHESSVLSLASRVPGSLLKSKICEKLASGYPSFGPQFPNMSISSEYFIKKNHFNVNIFIAIDTMYFLSE